MVVKTLEAVVLEIYGLQTLFSTLSAKDSLERMADGGLDSSVQ
jgi:hypothetical protein